ncbi:MAG: hypothetical protein Q9184_006528 [Pyrenodesmia sp. 2 TL-2023]
MPEDAESPSISAAGLDLLDLLQRHPAQIQNYEPKKFYIVPHDYDFIGGILDNGHQLFAILVSAKMEFLTFTLLSHGQTDNSLPQLDYTGLGLEHDEQRKLTEKCKIFSPVLRKNTDLCLPKGTVLPFLTRVDANKRGSFGQIFHVQVAEGHLEGYDTRQKVVEKVVRLDNPGEKKFYRREVETLRERKHPNVVPLLASYTLVTTESEHDVTSLHLIVTYAAEGDLADWMNQSEPPGWVQKLSQPERRAHLYRFIYALVSGLSFLHNEKDGLITAHHDLKPQNILVFGTELKIADFGRSHLRPLAQGSQTEGKFGLGTYEYHPPEYWKDDGFRAEIKHGRSFDMWPAGCIILELATLIVYGWESGKVTEFRDRRQKNLHKERPKLASQHSPDTSFHNNWVTVEDWIDRLQFDDGSQKLKSTLNVALQMMNQTPGSRLYAWEAELDLYNIQHPDADRVTRLEEERLRVQAPPPQARNLNGTRTPAYILNGTQTPLHRASRMGDLVRICELVEASSSIDELVQAGWSISEVVPARWSMSGQDHQGLSAWDVFNQTQESLPRKILHKRLVPATSKRAVDDQQGQELLQAAKCGDVSKVRGILAQGVDAMFVDQNNRSALYKAALSDNIHVVEYLVGAKGQELLRLKEDLWKDTPLHIAASNGLTSVLEKLLVCSPNIEDQQQQGKTALFVAAEWGYKEAIGVLLGHGAQVFTQSECKETPLHIAAEKHRPDILKWLLINNSDARKCLEHKTECGDTPLLLALWHGHVDC